MLPTRRLVAGRSRPALLAACGAGAAILYLFTFTLPYRLPDGLRQPLAHFGTLSGPSWGATLALLLSLVSLFALYLWSVHLCEALETRPNVLMTRGPRLALAIIYGFAAASALVLIWMYPIFSSDIFYYMSADRIWTVFHENPFVVPPLQAAHDLFFPYTRWGHYTLPYGPLWPWISAATSAFGDSEVLRTLVLFKALAVLGYLATLPLVAWATGRIQPGRQLTATCIFAWNPLVLIELAGNGHNEGIALVPVILGLGFWARRASAATALGLAASFAVKATVLVAMPALLWPGLRRATRAGQLPLWLLTHAAPGVALLVLAWVPWNFAGVAAPFREVGQYYLSMSALLMTLLPSDQSTVALRLWQAAGLALVVLVCFRERTTLAAEGRPALRVVWGLSVLYWLIIAPFYSPWYFLWPILFAAPLADRRVTMLTALAAAGALCTYVVQFIVRSSVPMTAAQLNALGMLVASLPYLVGWWWGKRTSAGRSGPP